MKIRIAAEYGRRLEIPESLANEWLDDLSDEIDETMSVPLRVGDDSHSSFARFAFCAPEVIRGAIATEILRSKLADHHESQNS